MNRVIEYAVKNGIIHSGVEHWRECTVRAYLKATRMVYFTVIYRGDLRGDIPINRRAFLMLLVEMGIKKQKLSRQDMFRPREKIIISYDPSMGGMVTFRILLKQEPKAPVVQAGNAFAPGSPISVGN